MAAFLPPVEKPRGLLMKLVYFITRRQFGKVAGPVAVFSARMPTAFLTYYGRVSRLDKKLRLPSSTRVLIRERVATINGCAFCMDATRWYALRQSPDDVARLDALAEYRTSPLFTEGQRVALDYTTELVSGKHVRAETFERLAGFYSEREICDIAWIVASEHLYNMTNIGLNIGSDGLCELPAVSGSATRVPVEKG
jgi:alkylhydroperoxidase family enzyme